jgi:starvation-inducible outer membrane lipoprotein
MKSFSSPLLLISISILSACIDTPQNYTQNDSADKLKEQMDQLKDPINKNERILGKPKNYSYARIPHHSPKLEAKWSY